MAQQHFQLTASLVKHLKHVGYNRNEKSAIQICISQQIELNQRLDAQLKMLRATHFESLISNFGKLHLL